MDSDLDFELWTAELDDDCRLAWLTLELRIAALTER